jgi:hypothetical protein
MRHNFAFRKEVDKCLICIVSPIWIPLTPAVTLELA